MPLNRRIVLEGPLHSPDPPKPEPTKTARQKKTRDEILQQAVARATGVFPEAWNDDTSAKVILEPAMSLPPQPVKPWIAEAWLTPNVRDFFEQAGMKIDKDFVRCKGCNDIANFDANFNNKTVQCCSCGRTNSFEHFESEHK